ncbi:4-hydroxyphenylalkanoate adenylyltransferase [BD1-7 clade bacterium]|uniref:4-hydroxyphenylalkanoate adenylyltransferase n=1 Tax=BD1-7 clade bacterium TaxID=2029982 RepID=A0A5S9PFP7_9GAMM|nr:4-hydroxyphenylalkanoate adenylyltransferase [BD1-7 clade bacterium]CAA0102850.1 4-hydroxyphenylalkanoate adenylyltransferase [BD1-7 clade bacterium]
MTTPPVTANSLVDVIQYWADRKPDEDVLRFYPNGEGESVAYSYHAFDRRIKAIATQLEPYRGERAILLFHSGINFLEAFFACFYAGVVAVPAYPPRRNHNLDRLLNIMNDCEPAIMLSSDTVLQQSQSLCQDAFTPAQQALPWINTDIIEDATAANFNAPAPSADTLAFLQYTSGSTGTPKGVMLTHKNLMTNVRMAHQAYQLPANARCVSWLPLFHDMGLIGAVMTPMYWGAGSVLMPPAAFLQKPVRWLRLLSEYGQQSPVGCTAPNFSFQLCVDQISDADLADLDLSPWIFAMNGAEPIRQQTMQAFADKFAPCGFNANAFVPAFGMAESTLLSTCRQTGPIISKRVDAHQLTQGHFVEAPERQEDHDEANRDSVYVSCGQSCAGQTLLIVDPDTREIVHDRHVGELWLQGDHIAHGYWAQQALSEYAFDAYTLDGQGPFMRTGDLAATVDGELYITGRLKDLLIIRGKNHYPQDIELTAAKAHDAMHLDNVAAVTVEAEGEEQLVLVAEVLRSHRKDFDAEAAALAISQAVAREHGIDTHAISFIRFASLPKTSSGKIQRYLVRERYQEGSLKSTGSWHKPSVSASALPAIPQTPMAQCSTADIELYMQQWLAAKLAISVDTVPTQASLDSLGLDSVDLVQLAGNLEQWLGQPMDNMVLWELPHIQAVATYLKETAETPVTTDDDEDIEGFI